MILFRWIGRAIALVAKLVFATIAAIYFGVIPAS